MERARDSALNVRVKEEMERIIWRVKFSKLLSEEGEPGFDGEERILERVVWRKGEVMMGYCGRWI